MPPVVLWLSGEKRPAASPRLRAACRRPERQGARVSPDCHEKHSRARAGPGSANGWGKFLSPNRERSP